MGHARNECKVLFFIVRDNYPLIATREGFLESIVLIHKLCTELVGSNQIKTVFDPEYKCLIKLKDMIAFAHIICDQMILNLMLLMMTMMY